MIPHCTLRYVSREQRTGDVILGDLDFYPAARARICNGVGPKALPVVGWAADKIFHEPNQIFRAAADAHDVAYWIGGGWRAKILADHRFLLACVEAALRRRAPVPLIGVAWLYFGLVACGGWIAFHRGRRRDIVDVIALDGRECARN